MSTDGGELGRRYPASDSLAGFLAALALFAGALSVVWYPGRLGPAAMLVALIAAALGTGQRRLAAIALTVVTLCWVAGMVVAVLADRPVF